MESILAQTHRLTDLISFLLDLSRIEAGSSSLNIEEFNFADFIDETIAPLKLLDSSRGHDIETHIPSNIVMEGDVDRLRQLYTNIIANALKHSLDDASVLVEAHVDDSRGTVVTNIVNFGSQIPEDVRHKIFQRFVMGITTRGSESGSPVRKTPCSFATASSTGITGIHDSLQTRGVRYGYIVRSGMVCGGRRIAQGTGVSAVSTRVCGM